LTLVTAGRVGKAHGLDGSFWVDGARHELPTGTDVVVGGRTLTVERRDGTAERPLLRLAGLADARPLRGAELLVEDELAEGEWLARDLEGCAVAGLGRPLRVARVIDGPSCSVLELDDGTLVPFVSDAVERVDPEAREIAVRGEFLP
jgi:16S rRNA processing protein RimM